MSNQNFWKQSARIAGKSRGPSKGIITLWDHNIFELIQSQISQHWIFFSLLHHQFNIPVNLFNLYVPNLNLEKKEYLRALQNFVGNARLDNIILVGDLNVTLQS